MNELTQAIDRWNNQMVAGDRRILAEAGLIEWIDNGINNAGWYATEKGMRLGLNSVQVN